jgi:myo-inositol-1(or 4)-monophosphatase
MQTSETLSYSDINHVADVIKDKIIPVTGPFIRTIYNQVQLERSNRLMQAGTKGSDKGEPTSKVDLQVTDTVRTIWLPEFPNYPILAEDFEDPGLTNMSPEQIMRLPGVLVLDGIDGSGRMLRGSDYFSTSFGFMSYGKIVLGIVHQPVGNHIWIAQEGIDGAFQDGQRMSLSTVTNLTEATGTTAYAWDREPNGARQYDLDLMGYLGRFFQQPDISQASSVLDIEGICRGESDVHISIDLKPWDLGASPYHIQKLGGIITDIDGNPWSIFSKNTLIAINEPLHSQSLALIQEAQAKITKRRQLEEHNMELEQELADLQQTNARLRRWKGLGAIIDSAKRREPSV